MTTHWSKLGDAAPPEVWALLEALALWAAADPALPPVEPDDFLYVARVERVGLPDVHVFKHVLTAGHLVVDDLGQLWRFVGRTSGVEGYVPVDGLADALDRAELGRAERLALRTRRGPRQGEGPGQAEDDDSSDRTASMVSASAGALSSR